MNITAFAIEKNRITIMLLLSVMLTGLAIYSSLSRDSMPPYSVRVANIVTSFPGASPARVELLVSDKVEKVAQELPELKELTSTSRTGISVVTVTLKDEVQQDQMQAVWDRLRRKITSIDGLPQGLHPDLQDDGIGDVYGIVVGITSDGFSYAEMKEYADNIKDDLIKIPEAAKVALGGSQEERVFVEFDNARLKEYGLSSSQLQSIITSTNILSAGGAVIVGDQRIILEPTGNFNAIDDIKNMLVPVKGGKQLVKLGDITTVRKSYIDPAVQIVRINGKEGVSMHVNLKKDANMILLGNKINDVISKWEKILPVGLELSRISSLDIYIDDKIKGFVANLMQSIGIVLVVMLVFLGLRTGFVIASLIPIVTITTLLVMGVMKIGLNQVTLAALIMALGMLVDNAIVVAETIMVKMEAGIKAKRAAIEAGSELFMPLLISTLTTSAAFLAFYMSPTSMGDIVGPIFVVITIALLSSWLIALTVITLFCCSFLKVKPQDPNNLDMIARVILTLKNIYRRILKVALNHKAKVLVLIFSLFCTALFGFNYVQFLFFPDSDRNMVTVDINLPSGTKIETTTDVVKKIEQYVQATLHVNTQRLTGVVGWSSYIGQGPESYDLGYSREQADSSYAHILMNTSSFYENNNVIEKLDAFGFENFPNAQIKVGALGSGGGGVPIEIKLSGAQPDQLANIAESIKIKLAAIAGTKNIKDDWGPKSKKFLIEIDQNRAQAAGLSSQDIATSLKTTLDGFQTGGYREDNKSIPIIMRSDQGQLHTLASLETLNLYAQSSGKSVPLLQVANIVPQWQYSKIKRLDQARTISITSELRPSGNAANIVGQIKPWLKQQEKAVWPPGYVFKMGGDAESSAENMGSVIKYLPLSAFIIVFLLIIQFNSFRKMLMVVLTIPLGIIGVVIGLLIFQEPFGFMPFLGVVSLAGIIINNAIVLIDRIEVELNDDKNSQQEAVVSACIQRFRPILLATFTTVLGLIPLYMSGGEMWEGMAVSIMVGLLFGTMITLVFLPVAYSVLYRVEFRDYQFATNDKINN